MGLIYHYTSCASALSILRGHSLWFTDCEYLNDPSELLECYDLYNRAWAEACKGHKEIGELMGSVDVASINPYKTESDTSESDGLPARHYSFSASTDNSSVGIWSGYASQNGGGCILAFDQNILEESLDELSSVASQWGVSIGLLSGGVSYNQDQLVNEIKKCIQLSGNQFLELRSANLDLLDYVLASERIRAKFWSKIDDLAPFVKTSAYEYEQEHRIILKIPDGQSLDSPEGEWAIRQGFRIGLCGAVTPYYEVVFPKEVIGSSLKTIYLMEPNGQSIRRKGMERLLVSLRYDHIAVNDVNFKLRS